MNAQKTQPDRSGGTTAGGSGPLSPAEATPIARVSEHLPMIPSANSAGAFAVLRAFAPNQSEEDR